MRNKYLPIIFLSLLTGCDNSTTSQEQKSKTVQLIPPSSIISCAAVEIYSHNIILLNCETSLRRIEKISCAHGICWERE